MEWVAALTGSAREGFDSWHKFSGKQGESARDFAGFSKLDLTLLSPVAYDCDRVRCGENTEITTREHRDGVGSTDQRRPGEGQADPCRHSGGRRRRDDGCSRAD